MNHTAPGTATMPRFALTLVVFGLLAILLTVLLVMGDATLPGRVPPFLAAALAALGGIALVVGLWLLDGAGAERDRVAARPLNPIR